MPLGNGSSYHKLSVHALEAKLEKAKCLGTPSAMARASMMEKVLQEKKGKVKPHKTGKKKAHGYGPPKPKGKHLKAGSPEAKAHMAEVRAFKQALGHKPKRQALLGAHRKPKHLTESAILASNHYSPAPGLLF